MPSTEGERVDASAIAQACGVSDRTIERWMNDKSWPRGEYVGRQHRLVWPVSALPEVLVRRGREIRIRERVQVWLAIRAARSAPAIVQSATVDSEAEAISCDPAEKPGRMRLVAPSMEEVNSRSEVWARMSSGYREESEFRVRALDAVEQLVREGQPLTLARETVARQLGCAERSVSWHTLWRWSAMVERVARPYWKYYLAPAWSGGATAACAPEAWDWFKADYLRLEAPAASACYRRLLPVAKKHGWNVPSLATLLRRVEREIPPPVRVLAREGEGALEKMYPAQERDKSMLAALEWVNADGHRFDVFVKTPTDLICRPVMVAFQDVFSGKVLAWRFGETESSELIRLTLADLVRKWGIPRHVLFDNGRGFAAKWLTGGTPNRFRFKVKPEDPLGIVVGLGCVVHWATPYHGQAKPIERAFKDLCEDGAKHPAFAGAYTGNNPMAKPENYASKAVPWDEFCKVMDAVIHAHNAREGRRSKVAAGRSFDETFAASYQVVPVRQATPDQLRTLLLASEAVTASARDGSVVLAGNRYWTEALSRYAGKRLILRVDPSRLHDPAHVYTLAGEYIGAAECKASLGFAEQSAATEHKRAKAQRDRAVKQQLKAERRMAVAKLADQLAELAPGETPIAPPSVIEAVFKKPRRAPTPLPSGELTEDEIRQQQFLAQVAAQQQRRW